MIDVPDYVDLENKMVCKKCGDYDVNYILEDLEGAVDSFAMDHEECEDRE